IIHTAFWLFNRFIPDYRHFRLNFGFVVLLLAAVYGSPLCIVSLFALSEFQIIRIFCRRLSERGYGLYNTF
ncbi:MAG: hypothetical protein ACRD82_23835, partial [Blastocatellia bacterium]